MKQIFFSLIVIACFFLQACPDRYDPDPDLYFNIINNYKERVYLFYNNVDTLMSPKSLPVAPLMFIEPEDTLKESGWSELYKNQRKLNIIIFNESTIKKYPWHQIQEEDLVDKRYVLTLDDLKAMNYTIVYVGN